MKIFKNIALTLTALFALSCSKELQQEALGEAVTVQYGVTVDVPTKALGDGKTANHVWYALYRADGSLANQYAPARIDADRKAICPVTMVKGRFINGGSIWETDLVPNVPIKMNYKTNILGELFVEHGKLQVVIVPNFKTPDEVVVM